MKKFKKYLLVLVLTLLLIIPSKVFAADMVTITFDTQGGSQVAPQEVEPGGEIQEPEAPTKENFAFVGWSTEPDGWYTPLSTIDPTDNMTLYAIWVTPDKIINEITLKVVLPEVGTHVQPTQVHGEYGDYISSLPAPELIIEDGAKYNGNAFWYNPDQDPDAIGETFETTIENGKEYKVLVDVEAEEGYYFAKNLRVNINGTAELQNMLYPEFRAMIATIKVGQVEYSITDGDNQTFAGADITIKTDGKRSNLSAIKFDGEDLSGDNYTLEGDDNTSLILKADYLKKSTAGEHTITFVYNDGEVSTKLTIPESELVPKTGDNIMTYVSMLGLSVIGLGIAYISLRKKSYNM